MSYNFGCFEMRLGCYAVNNFRHGSRDLTFADIKLHRIFIFEMAYWLKKTTIFEISVLKDVFAINSGVDFIKNFQSYQNGSN